MIGIRSQAEVSDVPTRGGGTTELESGQHHAIQSNDDVVRTDRARPPAALTVKANLLVGLEERRAVWIDGDNRGLIGIRRDQHIEVRVVATTAGCPQSLLRAGANQLHEVAARVPQGHPGVGLPAAGGRNCEGAEAGGDLVAGADAARHPGTRLRSRLPVVPFAARKTDVKIGPVGTVLV